MIGAVKEEAYARGLQPSASQSATLIECSWAFGKEFDRGESSEAARYGSAFHAGLAALYVHEIQARSRAAKISRPPVISMIAKQWDVMPAVDELKEHVPAAHAELTRWLRKNEFGIDFEAMRESGHLLVEQSVALKPLESGRPIPIHDESHRYHGLVPGEQPGTLDLAIVPRSLTPGAKRKEKKTELVLVLDHKTGDEDFYKPLEKAQLLSLAAGVMRWVGASEAIVGAFHARRRGTPKVHAAKVKLSQLKVYETRVRDSLARIGDGSLRPGAWCSRCPARAICPAQDGQLIEKAGDVLTGLTAAGGALSAGGLTANDVAVVRAGQMALTREQKLGHLYEIARLSEIMAARVRAEIKSEMIANLGRLFPELHNGYLTLREYEKENLSKSSVLEAYGKVAGTRLLNKLRKDGAITASKVVQMFPEKERGR